MNAVERLSFETSHHERIYEHIERNGTVSRDALLDLVQLGPERTEEVVRDLKCDEYVCESDGRLELGLGTGLETTQVSGTAVTVRPARQEDLPAIVDAIRRVIANVLYPSAEDLASRLDVEGVLKRHNDAETRMFFVATVDGKSVGWVHIGASTLQRSRRTVELTLGVRTEYSEQGIGSQLLEHGCGWAASNTYRKACQRLPRTNERGLAFLDARNWETKTIRRNHYDRGDERIDEVMIFVEL
ncbi:GNAT family N-acetyltransferase [Halomarina halobia]|uniref:GNAT family N-acetyltransferase n=1 Tax=Halomarina halobia TaxID=3033386 RepID=A0ABD6A721_9EURY|nr:GNAT family N-acetyltransferase [Halomarina sp. PSR21]